MSKRITISFEANIRSAEMANRVKTDPGLWTFAANTWYKLMEPFTPFDTGTLMTTVTIAPKEIHYMQKYASFVYNGDHMHFQTLHHPNASAHWDQAAEPTQKPKLAHAIQGYIDTRLRL